MPLYLAADADLPDVVDLVNTAYRGEGSRRGWTTEADYIDGRRIDVASLRGELEAAPGSAVMTLRDTPGGPLLGCVWVQPAADDGWYLGMLTVRPDLQDRRLGRTLLEAAERLAAEAGARRLRMTVINIRDSLIDWYRRRGYAPTGETAAFPYDDNRFGQPRRDDLHFVVLEKAL